MSETLNIAHRGARSLAPENTIAAAQRGVEAGADMWELDVQLTADDELIVMHDARLLRTSDARYRFPERRPWKVSEFSLSEIQALDCGSVQRARPLRSDSEWRRLGPGSGALRRRAGPHTAGGAAVH